jgi:nitroreductase
MNSLNFLEIRKSIRKYKVEPISDSLLTSLFIATAQASNTGNMQLYSAVVTKNDEMKLKLAPFHFNQKMVKQAPVVVTFCADINRFNTWCSQRNAKAGFNNFLGFLTASIDAIIAAQTFCIAAETKGLGICYLGTTIYNAPELCEILELPHGVIPVTTITLGWPDEEPEISDRLPIESFVFNEKYPSIGPSEIDVWYGLKENLSANIQFTNDNAKETLAQVFTDVRYKKSDNEFFSSKLEQLLQKHWY